MPATGPELCAGFRAFGQVVKCEPGAIHIYPSLFIQEIAESVFWGTIFQHDHAPKGLMTRFKDCATHLSNKYATFCREFAESAYLAWVPAPWRTDLLAFDPQGFFRYLDGRAGAGS